MKFAIPLGIFLLMIALLGLGLQLDPKKVPSPLIDKPAPAFSLPVLHQPQLSLTEKDMLGQVWLLNVWASWCVSCRAEHKVITHLAGLNLAPVIGLNYKDEPDAARGWLQQFGDPYLASVSDRSGDVGINWGVYGVPETFIVGADGQIKYKHIGPVTMESLEAEVIPKLKQLLN